MAKRRPAKSAVADAATRSLRHVLVVGGTIAEWHHLSHNQWAARRGDLAKAAAHAGAVWLTIRPYAAGPLFSVHGEPLQRIVDVREGCTVVVDPQPNGRDRFLRAVAQLRDDGVARIDDDTLTGVLMAPAPGEPDLTIILGPPDALPPSLVWELAYTELVFSDCTWADLGPAHIERAAEEFSRRHRRFGGVE